MQKTKQKQKEPSELWLFFYQKWRVSICPACLSLDIDFQQFLVTMDFFFFKSFLIYILTSLKTVWHYFCYELNPSPTGVFIGVDVLEKLHRRYGKLQMNVLTGSVLPKEQKEGKPKDTENRNL